MIERRTRFDFEVAKDREHVLEGLKIAVDHIDEVIRIIRASAETAVAAAELRDAFGLSERQSDAILNMRLARLTGLEIEKLEEELAQVRRRREELEGILASRTRRMEIVGEELSALVDRFGDDRRTEIVPDTSDLTDEDLIAEERMVITVSHSGYIKRIEPHVYRRSGAAGAASPAWGRRKKTGGAPLPRLDPRLPAHLHDRGPHVLAEGLPDSPRPADGAREADREPAPDGEGREDRFHRPGTGVQRGPLPHLRHPPGAREEDKPRGVPERARARPAGHQQSSRTTGSSTSS